MASHALTEGFRLRHDGYCGQDGWQARFLFKAARRGSLDLRSFNEGGSDEGLANPQSILQTRPNQPSLGDFLPLSSPAAIKAKAIITKIEM
jgi:hypothetical protein